MSDEYEPLRLKSYLLTSDGTAIKLVVEDRSGRAAHLELEAEILATLLMLLPASGGRIVQRAQNERLIHRLADFKLVRSPNNSRLLIFETLDGLTISFSLSDELSSELGHAHLGGGGSHIKTH
jgi:hypothetical protein